MLCLLLQQLFYTIGFCFSQGLKTKFFLNAYIVAKELEQCVIAYKSGINTLRI